MIAWIVGYRINERVKVTEKTERVLRIELKGAFAESRKNKSDAETSSA
jgi:hypothetical protein